MQTEIRFLQELEQDFEKISALERYKSRQGSAVEAGRPAPRRWRAWVGTAAAMLTVAWAIGFLAQGGFHFAGSSQASSASQAPVVGAAFPPAAPTNPGSRDSRDQASGYVGASATPAPPSASRDAPTADLSKIERDGSLAITIPDGSFKRAYRSTVAIAVANGGSLLSSETQDSGTGTLTLKIPAAKFDDVLVQLQKLGHVDASSVTGKDVTAEYIDQQAHLKILRDERNVLSQLVNNSSNVSQIVSLTARVSNIQEQIDATVGQLRYLNNQVAQSTIKVTISERGATPAEGQTTNDDITNPSLGRAWERGVQGFFAVLASVVVGLGYLVPLALITAIIAAPIMAVRRRRREAI